MLTEAAKGIAKNRAEEADQLGYTCCTVDRVVCADNLERPRPTDMVCCERGGSCWSRPSDAVALVWETGEEVE